MEVLQARIDSFKKSKRVKNPSKPSSSTTVRWPHPLYFKANPETLADAGFFYNPSYEGPDSVTCYVCDKELEGWEADDDPHAIHWKKCGQTCCWAIVRCGLLNDMDKSGRFVFTDKTRLPTHKLMEKARFDTFDVGNGWIHNQVKNHGANSKMMARAGFVYTPQKSNDDLVTCLYCNTSLSGWDANDDPIEEHRRRDKKSNFSCPFFSVAVSETSQSTKPPSKSQSKPPTRSTSKSKHQDILLPTKTHDGDPDNDSDSSQSTTATKATTKTPRKGRSTGKSSTKTPKGKTRSSSKSSLKNVAEADEDDTPLLEEPTVKKKARSRSKSVARSDPEQTNTEGEIQKKPLRSRSRAKAAEDSEDVPRKSSRSKVKASEENGVPKLTRTRSKIKVIESEPEQEPAITVKSRSTSKSKSKAPPEPFEESGPEAATIASKKASAESKYQSQTPADLFSDSANIDDYIPPPSSPPAAARDPSPNLTLSSTAKPISQHGDPTVKHEMKVVEISSDEEPEETLPEKDGKVKPVSQSGKENTGSTMAQLTPQPQREDELGIVFPQSRKSSKKTLTVEVVQPVKPSVPMVSPIGDADVMMGDIKPETNNHVYPALSTPQRPLTQPAPKELTPPQKTVSISTVVEPPLVPSLSKLPFIPFHTLSEAELDMTVEEWIRYQMDVEYDKFRRDGERELQRFRNQAEEVRKVIEGL